MSPGEFWDSTLHDVRLRMLAYHCRRWDATVDTANAVAAAIGSAFSDKPRKAPIKYLPPRPRLED